MTQGKTDHERAEALSRRRTQMLPAMAALYFSQQAIYFSAVDGTRPVDYLMIGAWVLLSAALLAMLLTRGGWFQPAAVRALLDDERTAANRMEGIRAGFIGAIGIAIFIYVASAVAPISARGAIHLIVSLSLGLALLRFGMLERSDAGDEADA